jgi:hypothetical protein
VLRRIAILLVAGALGAGAAAVVGGCGEDRGSLTIEGTAGEGTGTSPTATAPTDTRTAPTETKTAPTETKKR